MQKIIEKFLTYLLTQKRVSANTFAAYKNDLDQFVGYLQEQKISQDALSHDILKQFVQQLSAGPAKARTLARKISTLKIFFSYAHEQFGIENFSEELIFPKLDKRLPSALSEEEVEYLLAAADLDTSDTGFRNKTMLYLLYVSGLRISELVNLSLTEIHFDMGCISVTGKGGKGRQIPLPQPMLELLRTYIEHFHKKLIADKKHATDILFPTFYGQKMKPISRQSFWMILKAIWKQTGIDRPLSPHVLRHSFATHMLKRGADLRSLQILLGHENIATVEIYTHVETSYLREMYDKKHPRS